MIAEGVRKQLKRLRGWPEAWPGGNLTFESASRSDAISEYKSMVDPEPGLTDHQRFTRYVLQTTAAAARAQPFDRIDAARSMGITTYLMDRISQAGSTFELLTGKTLSSLQKLAAGAVRFESSLNDDTVSGVLHGLRDFTRSDTTDLAAGQEIRLRRLTIGCGEAFIALYDELDAGRHPLVSSLYDRTYYLGTLTALNASPDVPRPFTSILNPVAG